MNFIHRDINGIDLAIARLEKNYGDHYFIQQFCTEENWGKMKGEDWIRIIYDAFSEAKKIGASVVDFRLIEKFDYDLISEKLKSWGFSHIQDRIEYRSNLSELPKEEGSPIFWKAISSMEDSDLSEVVDILKKVAHGDPNFDPNADNLAELKGDLNDSTLSTGVDCVHIGYLQNEAIALVIAQVAPKTGWSRITYMGLDPKYRHKGLGKWVHRHGFTMLRNQGGLIYHGGTTSINLGMIRLFEGHGCKMYRQMQEWKWSFAES